MNRLATTALALVLALPVAGAFAADPVAPHAPGATAAHVQHHHRHHRHHHRHGLRHEVKMGRLTEPQAKELRADAQALHAKHRAMLQANAGAATTAR